MKTPITKELLRQKRKAYLLSRLFCVENTVRLITHNEEVYSIMKRQTW